MSEGLPTIQEYFKEHVDSKIDLDKTPSIPCPFHNEKTGKSFSFSKTLGIWRCFGACHCGGDVIELHKLNHKMKSREDAARELHKLYGLPYKTVINFERKQVQVNPTDVHRRYVYAMAVSLAKTVDDYIELDYILSQVPFDINDLETFCTTRGLIPQPLDKPTDAIY